MFDLQVRADGSQYFPSWGPVERVIGVIRRSWIENNVAVICMLCTHRVLEVNEVDCARYLAWVRRVLRHDGRFEG